MQKKLKFPQPLHQLSQKSGQVGYKTTRMTDKMNQKHSRGKPILIPTGQTM